MKAGMTKNSAGIGGKIESLTCMGATATITGGSELQRRHQRNYSKTAHAAGGAAGAVNLIPPLLNISEPKRVF